MKIPLSRDVADRIRLARARFSRKWDDLDPGRQATAFKLLVLCEILGGRKKAAEVAAMADNTLDNYRYGKQDPTFRTLEIMAERAGIAARFLGADWRLEADHVLLDMPENSAHAPYGEASVPPGMRDDVPQAYLQGVDEIAPAANGSGSLLDLYWKKLGVHPGAVTAHWAEGDSMAPTIADQTPVFIDTSDRDLVDGGIYAIRSESGTVIRRVQRLAGGGLQLLADNQSVYPPEKLGKRHVQALDVIGRVRGVAIAC